MIKANVKIDGQKKVFEIPQRWEELTTGSFCRLADVYRNEEREPSDTEIVAAIVGLPHSDILQIEAQSLDDNIFYNLMFLQSASGWSAIMDATPSRKFRCGDKSYRVVKDFGKITLGQKEEAMQVIESQEPFDVKAFNLLHVFYKDMTKEQFDKSLAMDVYPVISFFLRVWYLMQSISTKYLAKKLTTNRS